ncbi:MAG: hypothetical protein LBL18_01115 [Bacteroidales bacterium]|nr:hypothetical protein [Bacteroidales bacterium]
MKAELAILGRMEAACVRTSIECEYRTHFILGAAIAKLNEAYKRIGEMQRDITKAKKLDQRTWFPFTRWIRNAIVKRLELDLAGALKLMTNEHSKRYIVANNGMDKAEQLRKKAKEWRERRLAYFTGLIDTCNNPEDSYYNVSQDLDGMYMDALRDIDAAEEAIAASITNAISSHTDEHWSRYMIGRVLGVSCDFVLCRELQKMYKPGALGYDHTDLSRFRAQIDRLYAWRQGFG